jgi:hypothetical protein
MADAREDLPKRADDTADDAAIKTLVESVVTCIDRGDFVTLEGLYADQVVRDYTSLNGGEPEVTTNCALMLRWAEHLPGFDRTRHGLSNLSARVSGDEAVAEADVVADHWIGGRRWTVFGRHRYECARFGRQWRVTGQVFTFLGEEGDRALAAEAGAAAAADPNPYLVRHQARIAMADLLAEGAAGPESATIYTTEDPAIIVVEHKTRPAAIELFRFEQGGLHSLGHSVEQDASTAR